MSNKILELLKNKWVQLVLSFVVGGVVGVLFFPSSTVTEKEFSSIKEQYELEMKEKQSSHYQEISSLQEQYALKEKSFKSTEEEFKSKLDKLSIENSSLKQSMKKKKLKIVKPDGTVIEKEVEESNSEQTHSVLTQVKEEFESKVKNIEEKWKSIHESRVADLKKKFDEDVEKIRIEQEKREAVSKKERVEEKNAKDLRIEAGPSTEFSDVYGYIHASYPVYGPIFIGGGVSGNTKKFNDVRVGVGLEF